MLSFTDRLLWRRAHDYIKAYKLDTIAVTGSSDKTITVDAVTHALLADRRPHAARPPYHTSRRVVRGILGINESAPATWFQILTGSLVHEIATAEPDTLVLGCGLTQPGDIDTVARHLQPRVTIVTNIHSEHLDFFPNQAAAAHEYQSLPQVTKEIVILPADDPLAATMREHLKQRIITYGAKAEADVKLIRATAAQRGYIGEVKITGTAYEFHMPHIRAAFQLTPFLAALAAATACNIKPEAALKELQGFRPPPRHFEFLPGIRDTQLIDDTSASTPERITAALRAAHKLPAYRRFAILGDCPDLASDTARLHHAIGQVAAESVDILIAAGDHIRHAGSAALRAGIDVHHFQTAQDAAKWIEPHLKPQDLLLVAGGQQADMHHLITRLHTNPQK